MNSIYAVISMSHKWNSDTDGNSATVTIVFDFKKVFDLFDHHILIQKLVSYKIPESCCQLDNRFLFEPETKS